MGIKWQLEWAPEQQPGAVYDYRSTQHFRGARVERDAKLLFFLASTRVSRLINLLALILENWSKASKPAGARAPKTSKPKGRISQDVSQVISLPVHCGERNRDLLYAF